VPVLAEAAAEVAARRAEREDRRPRQKMVERLLLDRVDAEAARAPVGREHDLVALARPDEAEAALPVAQLALTRTDVALEAAVRERVPVASRLQRPSFCR